jgi:hypothetical protein
METQKKKPKAARPPVRVNVMLCPDDWNRIKHRAVDEGKSGSQVLRDLMAEALRGMPTR